MERLDLEDPHNDTFNALLTDIKSKQKQKIIVKPTMPWSWLIEDERKVEDGRMILTVSRARSTMMN